MIPTNNSNRRRASGEKRKPDLIAGSSSIPVDKERQAELPIQISKQHERVILESGWARHVDFKWHNRYLSVRDSTATKGYKGLGFMRHWKDGLGRVSGCGISGAHARVRTHAWWLTLTLRHARRAHGMDDCPHLSLRDCESLRATTVLCIFLSEPARMEGPPPLGFYGHWL